MISTFACFERTIIRERVKAGMEKSKIREVKLGRPKIPPFTIQKVLELKEKGLLIRKLLVGSKYRKALIIL